MDKFWPLMKDIITQEDKDKMIDFIQSTNRFTNGQKVREFEAEWSKWIGSKYSVMLISVITAKDL